MIISENMLITVSEKMIQKSDQLLAFQELRDCIEERILIWESFPAKNPRIQQFKRSLRELNAEITLLSSELILLQIVFMESLPNLLAEA